MAAGHETPAGLCWRDVIPHKRRVTCAWNGNTLDAQDFPPTGGSTGLDNINRRIPVDRE